MYHLIVSKHRRRRVYGIAGEGVRIEDISTSKTKVAKLAKRCRQGKLDPLHLQDVVEDWAGE